MRQMPVAPDSLQVSEFIVRKYEPSDAEALVIAVTESCEHLRPWMPWIKFEPQSVTQREELIKAWNVAWEQRTEFVMGVFLDDRIVGGTGIHLRGPVNAVEIGYWVHTDFTGRGIASQVSGAVTLETFQLWSEIDTVVIVHDEANIASGKVPARLGFEHVFTGQREPEAPGESGVMYRWEKKRAK